MDVTHHPEWIDASVFVAPGAIITGAVHLATQRSVWYHAVLRGDSDVIDIGSRTNVQDGVIIHVDPGMPCRIGAGVTIGHRAVVHGALIEDNVLIGIGAILLSGAQIGHDCVIGAGTVVTGRTIIPPGSMVLGVPGRVVRPLTDEEKHSIRTAADHYVEFGAAYLQAYPQG